LSFQGIPYAGGDHRTTKIEGVACSWLIHGKVLKVVALCKASLGSL
jgi:hypothetical protein